MVILIAAAIIAPLVIVCRLIDRRDRKRGHQIGDPSAIARATSEGRSDARAVERMPSMSNDLSWTAAQRKNKH
jgi:hypothetical protein